MGDWGRGMGGGRDGMGCPPCGPTAVLHMATADTHVSASPTTGITNNY